MGTLQNLYDAIAYTGPQAAHYVGVPYATLRHWIGDAGLISTPAPNRLSFNNLAEAYLLKAMRRKHGLSLQSIRRALEELQQMQQSAHPLLGQNFETDGVSLCIRLDDRVLNLSQQSQQEIREFVSLYLQRVERDEKGRTIRLYPFVNSEDSSSRRSVSISPVISFGRPTIAGTGIATAVVFGRYMAGDSAEDLTNEYELSRTVFDDCVRWEALRGKAA